MSRLRARMLRPSALVAMVIVLAPADSDAYLKFSTRTLRGNVVTLRWNGTPRYFVSDVSVANVSASAFQSAIARAFATWEAVPTATIAFQSGGFTTAEPFEDDDLSVVGFVEAPDDAEFERVLGATGFIINALSGEIIESDIFFNSRFRWSVASAGESGRFDLESVALHEVGHFLGLDHSAIGETELAAGGGRRVLASGAVMFPISFGTGNVADRELQPDDVAGVSDLYPAATFRSSTGVVRGRITKNGQPVFGAHAVAFNPETGDLIGGFSVNEEGEFEIAGLTPGPHVIRVEPLDDADVLSFFVEDEDIDVDFQVTYHDKLFVAPRGGVGERFEVQVRPK